MHDAFTNRTQNFIAMKNRTSNSAQTWATARCDVGTFFDHAEGLVSLGGLVKAK